MIFLALKHSGSKCHYVNNPKTPIPTHKNTQSNTYIHT